MLLTTPLLPVALAFSAGVAIVSRCPIVGWWGLWMIAAGATAIVLAVDRRARATPPLLLAVAALGALAAVPAPPPPDDVSRLAMPRAGEIQGRIAAAPVNLGADRRRLVVDLDHLDGLPRSGRIHLSVRGEGPPLSEGQRIGADARLRPVIGFNNPGGFDYAAFLERDGIRIEGSAPANRVSALDSSTAWHARVRERALEAIRRALPPVSSALLGGLLLGTRGELPRETLDDFRRSGVYHILAVSGFNVALLASSTFTALLLVRAPRRAAAITAMLVVIGFACVAGPEPSVIRAAIMGVLVLGALVLDREASVVNSLALAGIAILAVRPGDLLDPGFQLSFAATLGIVLAPIPKSVIAGSMGVSLAAQAAVLPITLAHFNQVSLIGIVANLAVVPLAAVATVLGLFAVTVAAASEPLAAPFFDAIWPVLLLLRAVVRLAAAVPGALVHLPAPGWAAIVCYAASLGLGLFAWRARDVRRSTSHVAGFIAVALMLAACGMEAWTILRPGDGRLRVAILDVGQGDAIVIESPDRRAFLVDAGSGGARRLDAGERVVAPYLWNRGILSLAGLVATHADVDHAGGMAAIRRLFRVDEDLSDAPDGLTRRLDGVLMTIHTAESRASGAPVLSRNDAARVVTLEYVTASFLLASDIGAAAESLYTRRGDALRAVVLKVAHHGSRHSSGEEFLRAVRPAVAVISVGARNAYGHPDADVLRRLTAAGARVYRTDRDGAVILETDGRTLEVTRWVDGTRDRYCLDPDTAC